MGPAVTFLFVGPAVNILAISFTGVQIGLDIALARVILSLLFGVLIGLIMAWVFRKDDEDHAREAAQSQMFSESATIPTRTVVFFLLLLGILVAGRRIFRQGWIGLSHRTRPWVLRGSLSTVCS